MLKTLLARRHRINKLYNIKIWIRLVASIWLMLVIAWSGMIFWTVQRQEQNAIQRARDFSLSVHQMTLGLVNE